MAIGDTVNAGLMRVDFSPFLQAGRANAAANASFGQALGQVAKGYIEGQEKKKRANEIAGFLMGQGVGEKDAQAIAKNPFLQKEYQRGQEAKAQMKMERERLATQANIAAQGRAARQAEIDQKNEREDAETQRLIGFSEDLISETTDPAVVQNADMARPGLFALGGDPEMRNRFLDAEIERQPKVTVGSLGSEDFATVARETGMDPRLSANRFMGLQKIEEAEELANQQPQKIARTITVQDGKGGFTQVGVDEAGNPVRDFGPPKPSGMYPTPEEQAKGKEDILSVENANDFVNKTRENSLESAKSIRPATRALTLLEKGNLDTGGIAELKTNTIAMLDSLGIPIDKETMDKVANTQNFRAEVGKFLFENISNTKGSISEKEMDIFAKISPGLQMTPEANKVLLQYVIKKAERDKDRVKFIQDMRRKGVSIVEQRNRLEDYMIENDLSEVLSPIAGQPSEQTPQNTFNLNGQNVLGEVVGTKPNGDKLIKVNGQIFVQPAQ